jgi:serine/threonine protein kinase
MVPHIADFGLAKLIHEPEDTNVGSMSCVVGTLGYIAPENGYSLRVNEKCDVYSYGVVLFELLTRKMAVDPCFEDGDDIVRWVKRRLEDSGNPFGGMDEEIDYWMENERDEASEVLGLAMDCCQSLPDARPSMREVVDQLVKVKSRRRNVERKENRKGTSFSSLQGGGEP